MKTSKKQDGILKEKSTKDKKKENPPRLYILIDKDNTPVGQPHLRERDAYDEKYVCAEAGYTVRVIPYEPAPL